MSMLSFALRISSPIFIFVGLLHLTLGLQADLLLGANIPTSVLADPVLDSQNRFYGVAFTLYGFLLYLCGTNLEKYQTVLRTMLIVFFVAGCSRIVSIAFYGLPSIYILVLLASELILPPMCAIWLNSSLNRTKTSQHD